MLGQGWGRKWNWDGAGARDEAGAVVGARDEAGDRTGAGTGAGTEAMDEAKAEVGAEGIGLDSERDWE